MISRKGVSLLLCLSGSGRIRRPEDDHGGKEGKKQGTMGQGRK